MHLCSTQFYVQLHCTEEDFIYRQVSFKGIYSESGCSVQLPEDQETQQIGPE